MRRGVPYLLLNLHRRYVYSTFRSPNIDVEHPHCLLCRRRYSTNKSVFIFTPPPTTNPAATCASFSSSTESYSDSEHDLESDVDDELMGKTADGPISSRDSELIMDILQTPNAHEKRKMLEQCEVNVTPGLVADVLSRTRNDQETAFTFFLWALRNYHSMIAVLGKLRKFDTAWSLIEEMRVSSLVTPQTFLIMIRKYAAAGEVAKAIDTFDRLRRSKFEIGLKECQSLLTALCRYKNVKEAENLLFSNKDVFPLNTKSFNIILNGWCNVVGDLRQGKRIWREMEAKGIKPDAYSYASIMSIHSRFNNLNVVLKFYKKMKALGIKPDRKVYNAVIHAMAKRRLVKEARSMMKTMEEEGFTPDGLTYNSLILPLCKSSLIDDAKQVFDEMTERGVHPTVRTYHAFVRVLRTEQEVFELLHRMHSTGCNPTHDTYIMLIKKFCCWGRFENVYKLWGDMSKRGLHHGRSSYIVMINGLLSNGRVDEANKFNQEMKERGFLPELKIDAMLQPRQ